MSIKNNEKKYYPQLNQELFERIEKYIDGTMSQDERLSFEKELQENELLRNEVELQQNLQMSLAIAAINKQTEQKESKSLKLVKSNRFYWGATAAALLLIAFPIYLIFFAQKDLYKEYYLPDPGLPTVMGSTKDYRFQDAMIDYKMKDYALAKDKWENLAKENPQNDSIHYYIAMANLNLNDYALADKQLSEISQNSTFHHKVLWYRALIALKRNNTEQAKKWLRLLNDNNAQELLKELEP